MTPTLTFVCSICGEPSVSICVYCTKDACPNHVCDRCGRCSDCCECDIRLDEHPEQHSAPPIYGAEDVSEEGGMGLEIFASETPPVDPVGAAGAGVEPPAPEQQEASAATPDPAPPTITAPTDELPASEPTAATSEAQQNEPVPSGEPPPLSADQWTAPEAAPETPNVEDAASDQIQQQEHNEKPEL